SCYLSPVWSHSSNLWTRDKDIGQRQLISCPARRSAQRIFILSKPTSLSLPTATGQQKISCHRSFSSPPRFVRGSYCLQKESLSLTPTAVNQSAVEFLKICLQQSIGVQELMSGWRY